MNGLEETVIGRSTVRVHGQFALPSAAFAAEKTYRESYPPEAYGTTLTVRKNEDTGWWIVAGSRATSCD